MYTNSLTYLGYLLTFVNSLALDVSLVGSDYTARPYSVDSV